MNSRLPRYPDGTEPSWYQPGGFIGQGLSRLGSYLAQKRPLAPIAGPWQMPGEFDPYISQPDPLLERTQSPSLMDAYGASQNATRGFFTGDNPVDSVRRARQGLMEGNTFPDAHYGFARLAPEGSELQRGLDRVASQLTDPLTLAFPGGGGLARASIATGIGGGEGLRQVARLAGYDEQGQETAGTIGNAVGGLAPSAPAIGRLGLRAIGSLNRALGDAPVGYVDPSRRGMSRAEIIPGIGPSDVPPGGGALPPQGSTAAPMTYQDAVSALNRAKAAGLEAYAIAEIDPRIVAAIEARNMPGLAGFRAAEAQLPPTPQGYTRVYRGEAEGVRYGLREGRPITPDPRTGEPVAGGSWYTTTLRSAYNYGTESGSLPVISAVDVPTRDLHLYDTSPGRGEYILSPELVQTRINIPWHADPVAAAPAARPPGAVPSGGDTPKQKFLDGLLAKYGSPDAALEARLQWGAKMTEARIAAKERAALRAEQDAIIAARKFANLSPSKQKTQIKLQERAAAKAAAYKQKYADSRLAKYGTPEGVAEAMRNQIARTQETRRLKAARRAAFTAAPDAADALPAADNLTRLQELQRQLDRADAEVAGLQASNEARGIPLRGSEADPFIKRAGANPVISTRSEIKRDLLDIRKEIAARKQGATPSPDFGGYTAEILIAEESHLAQALQRGEIYRPRGTGNSPLPPPTVDASGDLLPIPFSEKGIDALSLREERGILADLQAELMAVRAKMSDIDKRMFEWVDAPHKNLSAADEAFEALSREQEWAKADFATAARKVVTQIERVQEIKPPPDAPRPLPRYEEGTIDPAFVEMIRRMTADENVGGGSDIKTKVPNRTKGVSRLPLRNQVQEPIVQTPQPRSVGSSIASGLGNILSVATTPLLTVPKTGNALIDFLGSGVEGLTSPLGLGFTALAPFTGGASLGLSGLAGQAARVGTRVGAEALVGATAGLASQKAQELLPEDTNPLIRGGVGLGAGLLAGAAGVKAFQRVPAFAPPKKAAAFGVKVARDVELEPGGSKFITDPVTNQPTVDYSQIPSQPTGAPVRGVPIAPDTVPNMLYAVVGNRQKVIDTGRLRTGPVTGSAGSALDEVVTLFDNRDTADQLASDFKTIASAFKKPRADVISDLQASAGRDGWQWAGLFTKANTTEEILTDYFTSRSASKAVNPSLAVNPLEFASISEVRTFKPNEIGTVFVSKGSLQGVPDAATGTASGAMLTSDQTGSTPNLNLYGDVRLATGAQIQAVEADPAIRQFIQTLEDARVYAESNVGWEGLKKVRSAELTERVGKIRAAIAQARAAGKSTDEIDKLRSSLQKGQMATLELPPQFALNPAWLPAIMDKIQAGQAAGSNAPFTYFEGVHATEALNSLFTGNIFPNKSQMVDLQKVLGQQFTTALEAFSNPTARDKLFDILNIPRAVLASGDVSYPARQGLLLALADPITGAKMAMNAVRAYVSPKFAEEVNSLASGLTGTPLQQAKSNALLRWGMDVLGEGSSAEEQFRMGLVGKRMFGSNEAGRIMRASDRSYSTAGNYQRWTTGQKYLDEMIAIHLKPGEDVNDIKIVTDILANRISETDGEQLAKTLNVLTGRTSWKKLTQGDLGQILNAGFFSPGFFASRIQAPFLLPARLVEYAKADPRKLLNPVSLYMSDPILKLQANMFGGMIAQGLGIYGMIQLAHAAGAPDVDMQLNPLKADFGKLKIGETRYDLWGGYTPMVRLVAQEITGKRIGVRGEEYEANRAELVSQFMRSKVSPTVGFGWDVATGQNFTNQRVSFERNSIEEQTISAITPLFIQDIIAGFKEDGVTGGIKALPSVFGTGVQSFTSINALKDSVASEITGGKKTNYKDLTGAERAAADQDQRLIMKKIEQEQGIPANSFAEAMRTLLEDRQNQERLYMWRGAQGMDTRKQISDNMAELQQITTAKREQALKDFNVPGAAEPTSALQEGLAAWRNLYNLSDIGAGQNIKTGKIDWDTFESLQQELFKSLTPEQTTFIEERARYSSTEEAQWWFNNRDYVNSTEYYKIPTQVFGKFSERIGRIDEDIQSYGDLITSVDYLKYSDPNKYRVLNSVLTSIKKDVAAQRKTMRTRNPELDVALYQLGRANTVLTPKAKNMMGGADAWVDSNTGQPD